MALDMEYLEGLIKNKAGNVEGYTVTDLIGLYGHDRPWWSNNLRKLIEIGACKCVGQREVKSIGYEFTGRTSKSLVFTFMEQGDDSK